MAILKVLSSVGEKAPAAFLVEIEGKNILLDAGIYTKDADLFVSDLDAIVLSHMHYDHTEALYEYASRARKAGKKIKIYATGITWNGLALSPNIREDLCPYFCELPSFGTAYILDFLVTVGRTGHCIGGIWIHFHYGKKLTYMGDWSVESALIPFDEPPSASLLITDASHGEREQTLSEQSSQLAQKIDSGGILCVPIHSRGPELAYRLYVQGKKIKICEGVSKDIFDVLSLYKQEIHEDTAHILRALMELSVKKEVFASNDIVVCHEDLISIPQVLPIYFSGYVAPETHGKKLLDSGLASQIAWNAHPRMSDNISLIQKISATTVLLAFCNKDKLSSYETMLGEKITWNSLVDF